MKYPIILRLDCDKRQPGLFATLQSLLEVVDDPKFAIARAAFHHDRFYTTHLLKAPKCRDAQTMGIKKLPQLIPCFCPQPRNPHGYGVLGMITTTFEEDGILFDRMRIEVLEVPDEIPITPEIFTPCRWPVGASYGFSDTPNNFAREWGIAATPDRGAS